eukprot:365482-Chlamydomonas_euryale.AAC.11
MQHRHQAVMRRTCRVRRSLRACMRMHGQCIEAATLRQTHDMALAQILALVSDPATACASVGGKQVPASVTKCHGVPPGVAAGCH